MEKGKCETCKWHRMDYLGEWVCTNPDSTLFIKETGNDDKCNKWRAKNWVRFRENTENKQVREMDYDKHDSPKHRRICKL